LPASLDDGAGARLDPPIRTRAGGLRGTAVTRLALAEASETEIAAIAGHSPRDVRSIFDAHYLACDPGIGDSAIAKLERRK